MDARRSEIGKPGLNGSTADSPARQIGDTFPQVMDSRGGLKAPPGVAFPGRSGGPAGDEALIWSTQSAR